MTTVEIKAQFQKEIENEQNSLIIEKLQTYYQRLKTAPCRFTEEELREEVARSIEDANNGGGKSLADMKKKHPRR